LIPFFLKKIERNGIEFIYKDEFWDAPHPLTFYGWIEQKLLGYIETSLLSSTEFALQLPLLEDETSILNKIYDEAFNNLSKDSPTWDNLPAFVDILAARSPSEGTTFAQELCNIGDPELLNALIKDLQSKYTHEQIQKYLLLEDNQGKSTLEYATDNSACLMIILDFLETTTFFSSSDILVDYNSESD
jgi:hypothetical protein